MYSGKEEIDIAKKAKKMDPHPAAGKTADSSSAGLVSSPASTGEAGAFFEQHVAAYWLAQLLVQSIPPILLDCAVMEVHLQTEHLGWHTDDFLIVGQTGSGDSRKLVGQVKRTFTVSATNDECKKTVQDFWKDFKNPQQFSPATDRFALERTPCSNTSRVFWTAPVLLVMELSLSVGWRLRGSSTPKLSSTATKSERS
jgi:hypothetical protein